MKKNGRILTSLISDAHSYTRSSEPWSFGRAPSGDVINSRGKVICWKLFQYISGGGLKSFGRTVEQDERDRRQARFLVAAGVLAFIWLLLLVI